MKPTWFTRCQKFFPKLFANFRPTLCNSANGGNACNYRRSRHLPFSLYYAYSGIVSCDFAAKCSIGVVSGAVLCSQPIHFGFYRHLIRMSIIAHRHSHAGVAHDILQGLWVHALVCHPGTKCVPTGMGCNIGQGLVMALVILLDKAAEHIVIVNCHIRQSLWIET